MVKKPILMRTLSAVIWKQPLHSMFPWSLQEAMDGRTEQSHDIYPGSIILHPLYSKGKTKNYCVTKSTMSLGFFYMFQLKTSQTEHIQIATILPRDSPLNIWFLLLYFFSYFPPPQAFHFRLTLQRNCQHDWQVLYVFLTIARVLDVMKLTITGSWIIMSWMMSERL